MTITRTLLAALCTVVLLSTGWTQQQPGGGNQNNQNQAGGIAIDAQGIVSPGFAIEPKLDRKRLQAAAAKGLPADLNRSSECRKVSLPRLAAAVADSLNAERPLTAELQHLAGLTRIDYVFVDPEHQDLVLAGPAEGFAADATGRQRGVETGRPILRLEDLIVALRTVPSARTIGCSIDPVPERLAAMSRYIAQNSSAASLGVVEDRYRRMTEILGPQAVRVLGVPDDSEFARILVAADYRMKRLALGLEPSGVKGLPSQLSLLKGDGNSLQLNWFVPLYEGLYRSEDGLAFEFRGQRVQLMAEDEFANAQGQSLKAATKRLSTQKFALAFTEHFAELADRIPVFAELQGLVDWCLVAALIDREQLATKSGGQWDVLLDAERLPHRAGDVPQQARSVHNTRRLSRGTVVGLICGGVTIAPQSVLREMPPTVDPSRRLDSVRSDELQDARPAEHPWWWD